MKKTSFYDHKGIEVAYLERTRFNNEYVYFRPIAITKETTLELINWLIETTDLMQDTKSTNTKPFNTKE